MAHSTIHGSASFWNPPSGKNTPTSPEEIFFGFAVKWPHIEPTNYAYKTTVKSHFLTVAQNRSGKGVSLIVPNLLHYGGSAVVVDPKGELAWLTFAAREVIKEQKVFILDPWGEVKRQYVDNAKALGIKWRTPKTSTFNPLALLDPANDNYAEDLAYIADALIINQSSTQPFFDDSARELVAGLIAYLVETAPADEINFSTVRGLIALPLSQLKSCAVEAQKLPPDSIARRKLGMFADDGGSDKELASILSTAKQQTAILDSAALCRSMEGGEDVFSALVEGKGATVYLVLPVDKLQTYGRWLRLMISFAIRSVARYPGKLQNQVLMFLDEFGTIGKLSAVAQAFGLMAGRNLSIWAFLQDLNQLKKHYKDDWETFIANSQAITVFGIQDHTTARYFSDMLGTTTEEIICVATAEARKKRGQEHCGSMQDKTFARALLLPEEVIQLTAPENNSALLFGGPSGLPVLLQRSAYWKTGAFRKMTPPNPLIPEDVKRYQEEQKREEEAKAYAKEREEESERKAAQWEALKQKIKGVFLRFFSAKSQRDEAAPLHQSAPQEKMAEGETVVLVEDKKTQEAEENKPQAQEVTKPKPTLREYFSTVGDNVRLEKARPRIGRNDPCPCGSGQKFKKCCGRDAE